MLPLSRRKKQNKTKQTEKTNKQTNKQTKQNHEHKTTGFINLNATATIA